MGGYLGYLLQTDKNVYMRRGRRWLRAFLLALILLIIIEADIWQEQTEMAIEAQARTNVEMQENELYNKEIKGQLINHEDDNTHYKENGRKIQLEKEQLEEERFSASAQPSNQNTNEKNNGVIEHKGCDFLQRKFAETRGEKVAYLTFDDGPSSITPQILDILKRYDVKATFFVIGNLAKKNPSIIKREIVEGHIVANHSCTHNFKKLYSSTEQFRTEVEKTDEILKNIIGTEYNIRLFRFPGGSFGSKLQPYRDVLMNIGYNYIDWNALNGDAEAKIVAPAKQLSNIKETVRGKNCVVILMHDANIKKTTVETLPGIIEFLFSEGYEIRPLIEKQ